jgi:hypothetical protein
MVLWMTKSNRAEPVKIDLAPGNALQAILEVDQDLESARPGASDMSTPQAGPLAHHGDWLNPNEHGPRDALARRTTGRQAGRPGDG